MLLLVFQIVLAVPNARSTAGDSDIRATKDSSAPSVTTATSYAQEAYNLLESHNIDRSLAESYHNSLKELITLNRSLTYYLREENRPGSATALSGTQIKMFEDALTPWAINYADVVAEINKLPNSTDRNQEIVDELLKLSINTITLNSTQLMEPILNLIQGRQEEIEKVMKEEYGPLSRRLLAGGSLGDRTLKLGSLALAGVGALGTIVGASIGEPSWTGAFGTIFVGFSAFTALNYHVAPARNRWVNFTSEAIALNSTIEKNRPCVEALVDNLPPQKLPPGSVRL